MAKPVRTRAAVVSRNRLAELTSRPNLTSAQFQQSTGRATTIIVAQSAYVHGAGGAGDSWADDTDGDYRAQPVRALLHGPPHWIEPRHRRRIERGSIGTHGTTRPRAVLPETPNQHDRDIHGSRGWTRTSNPSINSRMLCQLSYAGLSGRDDSSHTAHSWGHQAVSNAAVGRRWSRARGGWLWTTRRSMTVVGMQHRMSGFATLASEAALSSMTSPSTWLARYLLLSPSKGRWSRLYRW